MTPDTAIAPNTPAAMSDGHKPDSAPRLMMFPAYVVAAGV